MSLDVIKNYFLNVGASFRQSDYWKDKHSTNGKNDISRIGRFGVGVLAAYLLGNEIEVKTRSAFESEGNGLKFKCDNIHSAIELKCVEVPIGTNISIKISSSIFNYLNNSFEKWYWYYLNEVEYKIFLEEDDEKYELSLEIIVDEDSFYQIETASSCVVKWNYKKFPIGDNIYHRDKYILLCNGIKIDNYDTYNDGFEINKREDNIKINNPSIIVKDREGIFPLNLQRASLVGVPDFLNDLKIDIYNKILDSILENRNHKNNFYDEIKSVKGCSGNYFAYGENLKIFFDISLLSQLNIDRLCYVVKEDLSELNPINVNWFGGKNSLFIPYDIDNIQWGNIRFLRNMFKDDYHDIFKEFPSITKRFILLNKQYTDKYIGSGKVPPTFWKKLYSQQITTEYFLFCNINFDYQNLGIDFDNLIKYMKFEKVNYLLFLDFEWSERVSELTLFANTYKERISNFNLL